MMEVLSLAMDVHQHASLKRDGSVLFIRILPQLHTHLLFVREIVWMDLFKRMSNAMTEIRQIT